MSPVFRPVQLLRVPFIRPQYGTISVGLVRNSGTGRRCACPGPSVPSHSARWLLQAPLGSGAFGAPSARAPEFTRVRCHWDKCAFLFTLPTIRSNHSRHCPCLSKRDGGNPVGVRVRVRPTRTKFGPGCGRFGPRDTRRVSDPNGVCTASAELSGLGTDCSKPHFSLLRGSLGKVYRRIKRSQRRCSAVNSCRFVS